MNVEYQMIPECPDCASDNVAQIAQEPDKTAFHCDRCHKVWWMSNSILAAWSNANRDLYELPLRQYMQDSFGRAESEE